MGELEGIISIDNQRFYISDSHEHMSQKVASIFIDKLEKVLSVKKKANIMLSAGKTHQRAYEIIAEKYKTSID